MCIIMVCRTSFPNKNLLRLAEDQNPDGAGIAYASGNQIEYIKGLKVDQIWDIMQDIELPYMIHFRWASAGGVNPELCHPFPISDEVEVPLSGRADSVIMHNGHIKEYQSWTMNMITRGEETPFLDIYKDEETGRLRQPPFSDSRALAFMVHKYGEKVLKVLEDGNRFAIMYKPSKRHPRGLINTWGYWEKVEGVYLSNDPIAKIKKGKKKHEYEEYLNKVKNGLSTSTSVTTAVTDYGKFGGCGIPGWDGICGD